jgi:hypothetical protein
VKFSLAFPMRHDPVNQQIYGTAECRAVGQVAVVRRRHATG